MQALNFDKDQASAVEACCDPKRRVVAITGEAGSGKTTIMRYVYERLRNEGVTVALASPTGKASRRIKEATGIHAVTLHKLLRYSRPDYDVDTGESKGDTLPSHHKANPLPFDVLLVDEYAMVSQELHRNTIDALKPGARICVFGDINQLPPIEQYELQRGTTAFESLLRLPGSITLTTVHRQAAGNPILVNAHRIKAGSIPLRRPEFPMHITDNPVADIVRFIDDQIQLGVDYRKVQNQIISPVAKTWIGAFALNTTIQAMYYDDSDPDLPGLLLPRHKWNAKLPVTIHVGEKVICTENTYDLRDYHDRFLEVDPDTNLGLPSNFMEAPDQCQMLNGETGVVLSIDASGGFEIDFGDRIVYVPPYVIEYIPALKIMVKMDVRKRIDLAYVITTHKAQGSEFENVAYVMNRSGYYNQSRNNFYTAVTRARKTCTLFTDSNSLTDSIRYTTKDKEKNLEKYKAYRAAVKRDEAEKDRKEAKAK